MRKSVTVGCVRFAHIANSFASDILEVTPGALHPQHEWKRGQHSPSGAFVKRQNHAYARHENEERVGVFAIFFNTDRALVSVRPSDWAYT